MKEKFSLIFFALGLGINLMLLEGCAKSNITELSIAEGSGNSSESNNSEGESTSEGTQAEEETSSSSDSEESSSGSGSSETTTSSSGSSNEAEEQEEEEVVTETFTLSGTYLDSNGQPISGVKICIDIVGQSEPLCTTTGTGETAGEFSFPSEVPAGDYTIYPDPDEVYADPPHSDTHPSEAFGSIGVSTDDIGQSGTTTVTVPKKGKLNLQLKWEGDLDLDAHLVINLGAQSSGDCNDYSDLNMKIFKYDSNCYGRVNYQKKGASDDFASLDLDNQGDDTTDDLPFLEGENGRLETITIDLKATGELYYDEYFFYVTNYYSSGYPGGTSSKNFFANDVNVKVKIFGDAPGFDSQVILPSDDTSNTYPDGNSEDIHTTWNVLKLTKRSSSSEPLGILNITYPADFVDDCRDVVTPLSAYSGVTNIYKCRRN